MHRKKTQTIVLRKLYENWKMMTCLKGRQEERKGVDIYQPHVPYQMKVMEILLIWRVCLSELLEKK